MSLSWMKFAIPMDSEGETIVFLLNKTLFIFALTVPLLIDIADSGEANDLKFLIFKTGDNVTMDCKATTFNSRRWSFSSGNSTEVLYEDRAELYSRHDESFCLDFDNYSLTINSARFEHEGTYRCSEADIKNFSVYSLIVTKPPKVIISVQEKKYQFFDNNTETNLVYVNMNEAFTAECYAIEARPAVNLTWTVDDEIVEFNASLVRQGSMERGEYTYTNTTVELKTVLEGTRGKITCSSNLRRNLDGYKLDKTSFTIMYMTYALPQLSLQFGNGHKLNDSQYLHADIPVKVTCSSLGGRPPTISLSWYINGVNIIRNTTNGTDTSNINQVTSCIELNPESPLVNITCVAVIDKVYVKTKIEKRIHFYECPQMTVMINDGVVKDMTVISKHNKSVAICSVRDPIVGSTLTWEYDDEQLNVIQQNSTNFSNGNNDFKIRMVFSSRTERGHITCMYRGPNHCKVTKTVTVASVRGGDSINNSLHWEIYISIFTVVALIIGLFFLLKMKVSVYIESIFTDNKRGRLSPENDVRNLPTTSRELPALPSLHLEQIYDSNPDVKAKESNSDYQFLYQLAGKGMIISYWLATIASDSDKEKTKVIAKTVSENASMKEMLNFRALARNLMTLKRHENVVETLSVAIDDVPYYIYQEYITCGTLKDFLLRNYQSVRNSIHVSNNSSGITSRTQILSKLVLDICEGMFFLSNEKYRHPALAARKVLLTSSGRCKLHDFWPVELSHQRVETMLRSKDKTIAWLAPETVFLGQYVEKSDVWNFGVVAWEIFSLGEIPYGGLSCSEIENKLREKDTLSQPLACPGGIFGVLLSTWNTLVEHRPPFKDILESLKSFGNTLEEEENEDFDEPQNYFVLEGNDEGNEYQDY